MMMISPATQFLLSLSMLKGVGPVALKRASLIPDFCEKEIDDLANEISQVAKALSGGGDWQKAKDEAARQIEHAERHLSRILSPIDDEYPRLLAATRDDPFILYVKGSLTKQPEKSVAIIGTREPTMHGEVVAGRITQFFAEQGWSIVSGLAIGCDAIAHQAALEAGAHTVAVLAHGLQMVAPARHKSLANEIVAAGGALVSEYPFGQNVQNQQYVKRDRTQAGMARGVVMVQSDLKGGSLHASRAALDYGRWLAIPYPTGRDRESGEAKVQANLLMADGADSERASLLRCPEDALRQLIILRSKQDYLRMLNVTDEDHAGYDVRSVEAPREELQLSFGGGPDIHGPSPTTGREGGPADEARPSAELPESEANASSHQLKAGQVVLTRDRFKDLNIVQYQSRAVEGINSTRVDESASTIVLAARLHYLQVLLDDLRGTLFKAKAQRERENDLFVGFFLENFLVQMKRTVEIAVSLERRSHGGESVPVSEPSHLQSRAFEEQKPEIFLRKTLAVFEKSLLQSIDAVSDNRHLVSFNMDIDRDRGSLYFDDLVRSFNQVVAGQLPAEV